MQNFQKPEPQKKKWGNFSFLEKEDRGRKREGKGKRKDGPSVTSKKRRNQWFTEREEGIHTAERCDERMEEKKGWKW